MKAGRLPPSPRRLQLVKCESNGAIASPMRWTRILFPSEKKQAEHQRHVLAEPGLSPGHQRYHRKADQRQSRTGWHIPGVSE